MTAIRRSFIDGPYGQVHLRSVTTAGDRQKPLLLLHMLPQSSAMFVPLMERLGEDRMVFAPDFPGYGESAAPDEPILAEDYAAAIWAVVDQLSEVKAGTPIDVFGVHGGAKLSVELTLQRPDQVGRLLLSSLAHLENEGRESLHKAFTPVPLDAQGTRFRSMWQMIVENSLPGITLEQAAQSLAEMLRGGEKYAWANLALLQYNDGFGEKLDQLSHHVDLINPGDSLFEQTRHTRNKLKSVTYHERPDWPLMFVHSHTDALADLVLAILSREEGAKMPEQA